MSRIANSPIDIPSEASVSISKAQVGVKGPMGRLSFDLVSGVEVVQEDNRLSVKAVKKDTLAMAGTVRSLINNMVLGVTKGFAKDLKLVGVGYRAQAQGKVLNLSLGFSHPVAFQIPEGITIETSSPTDIRIKGVDKQQVGQVAANIRSYRPPEPYKGKGVRYADEQIKLKEAKKK